MRRASVSISLNIAEGSSRGQKEFSHFIDLARGSCYELIPLLEITLKLNYIASEEQKSFYQRIDNIAKSLNALKKSIKNNRQLITDN